MKITNLMEFIQDSKYLIILLKIKIFLGQAVVYNSPAHGVI